jgi:DNA-binding XRE family transcriptional regulator
MISNLVTGRQLRAAHVLAGLTQQGLAHELKVNERAVRFWERKHDRPPASSPNLKRIEEALQGEASSASQSPIPGSDWLKSGSFETSTRPRATGNRKIRVNTSGVSHIISQNIRR